MFSCTQEKELVTVEDFAELSATYVANIKAFEERINPTDFNSFQQIKDSIRIEKMTADSVLSALYTSSKDTVFVSFTQSENTDKIAIQDVWIVGADYDQLLDTKLEAGEVYVFSGKIDKIHLLQDFSYLQFDEKIKKW
jgi:hypothetical protein